MYIMKAPREIDKKLEMEKLSINDYNFSNNISITNQDNLKTKLRHFGIKHDVGTRQRQPEQRGTTSCKKPENQQ